MALIFTTISLFSQNRVGDFQFALVTDTHIGGSTAAEDLRNTVKDINANDSLSFVIISGDVTEFGSDAEFLLARQILDSLNKPWYIIPGNHDTKWSESGGNSFRKVFGAETFAFTHGSFLFIGTNSGPNMRMGPGQIPRENVVWLDSLIKNTGNNEPRIVYINHYPQNEELNNWYEAIDRLKTRNIQLTLCGHGHVNKQFATEGIPSLMCRSNLRAREEVGAYNIMHVIGDTIFTASVRYSSVKTLSPWASVNMQNHLFSEEKNTYPRPDFSVNKEYPGVREVWRVQEKSDVGCGLANAKRLVITSNTDGYIKAYRVKDGNLKWQYPTRAKIYGTPIVSGSRVIEAATDGKVYALSIRTGRNLWTFDAQQRIVASPVIDEGQVFITGSGGKCYSLSLNDGKVLWCNNEIKGFVETIPLVYKGMLLFGTWDNRFYALEIKSGKTLWIWQNGYSNRMLSPAACVPVAVNNRIFIVAPDRKMACLDAGSGKLIWHSDLQGNTVRESMGISEDSTLIYAKTMDGNIIGISASAMEGKIDWKAEGNIGYDIAPSVIKERDGLIFVASDKGFVYAFERKTGKLTWVHRISSCLINQVLPVTGKKVYCTTMDGVITLLGQAKKH